ncbi:response regulator transcription factor [Carboxylicivirga marina]|uniref:response regulator transcription factor n=1 Tax=Carboxylicivirga marina TaxID=2800988 RepID=UPI002599C8BF|nr:LuxR C-terminal-related transcriptional regulator [uncultured Carboxylicivirga sp.]
MHGVEFFFSPDGDQMNFVKDGKYHEFNENQVELIKMLDSQIETRYPDAHKRTTELYNSRPNYRYLRVLRFCKCNWGKADEQLDIDLTGNWNLEKVNCPIRNGFCPHEDVICNPRGETGLTNREEEVVKLIMKDDKEIAATLFVSVHTVENHIQNIKRKLNLHRKGEILNYAHQHKLIK